MKKWIWLGIIVFIIIVGLTVNVYINAVKPVKAASSIAEEIAQEEAGIESVDDFTLFHGSETYYIVEGKDASNEEVIVWMEEETHTVTIKKKKDGLSKQEAINILSTERNLTQYDTVQLAMYKGKPSWEIYSHTEDNLINYYYVDFETGEILLTIENI